MAARQGKVARLPAAIREQLNHRLLDNEPASKILPWLNSLPETLRILDEHFGEEPVTPQNLSDWRKGGFQDWLGRRERTENLKFLSDYSLNLAKSAGSISEGSAAILAGHILETVEAIAGADAEPTDDARLGNLVKAVKSLREGDLAKQNLAIRQKQASQKAEELTLARDKFEHQTVEQFMKWARSKPAQSILESGAPPQVQFAELRTLFFGPRESDESCPAA